MSKAAHCTPSRSASIGAAPGVTIGWVTEAMTTAPSCEASMPAAARASRAACSAMSTTDSSRAAKRRVTMPERSRIHSSEESMRSTSSELGTTRSGR